MDLKPKRGGEERGDTLVLSACVLASALRRTLRGTLQQHVHCGGREEATVYFVALSIPFFWDTQTSEVRRFFPYPHVGPLLQPAQAGRCRVRVPPSAPPLPYSSCPSSVIRHKESVTLPTQAPRQGQALPGSCVPQTLPAAPAMDRWYLGESSKPVPILALSNLDSGDH